MLDRDVWAEVWETIRTNKLRTGLTGFSVAWGIFMLLVLLGSGQGIRNGIEHQFRDDAMNSIWIRGGQTALPWQGLKPGRDVRFTNQDFAEIREGVAGIEHMTGRFFIQGSVTVARGRETGSFDVRSVHPDHRYLERTIVTSGRFLNDLDLTGLRKTAVVGRKVVEALYAGEDPVGSELKINGIAFRVVGTFEDEGGEAEMEKIYIPISTSQRVFNGADRIHMMMLTTGAASVADSERMVDEIRRRLSARHRFSPEDRRAVVLSNNVVEARRFGDLMTGIRLFVWAIGIGTILAGVVGVSNIMLITVRDRTKEIGVRKAVGATPWSIVSLVLQESVFLTAAAGGVGLFLGLGVLELANRLLPPGDGPFRNPSVDLATAVQATFVLILAGTAAGLVPARRAARIRPIEALRDE